MRLSRVLCLVVAVGPFILAAGCSGKKGKVDATGTVNLNGSPLALGTITLIPASGKASETASAEIVNGSFTLVKAVPGEGYKVVIDTERKKHLADPDAAKKKVTDLEAKKANMVKTGMNLAQAVDTARIDEEITQAKEEEKQAKAIGGKFKSVPKKYTSEKTSDVTITIKEGTLDPIELKGS